MVIGYDLLSIQALKMLELSGFSCHNVHNSIDPLKSFDYKKSQLKDDERKYYATVSTKKGAYNVLNRK